MLKKFIALKNIGRFVAFSAVGDTELKSLTLVYGANGRGKTTLCSVLRSLSTGDPAYLLERSTLGQSSVPAADVLTDTGNARFASGAWTTTCPHIAVFDSEFVHSNVYSGDTIEHEHKKSLARVIVGAAGVELTKKIESLNRSSRDHATVVAEAKAAVQTHVPTGMAVDDFLKISPSEDTDFDRVIADTETSLTALKHIDSIRRRAALLSLHRPTVPDSLVDLLQTQLSDIEPDAEQLVNDHLQSHTNGATTAWLSDGLEYQQEEACPYCGQSTSAVALIRAYRTLFGGRYKELKNRINRLRDTIDAALGEAARLRLIQTLNSNDQLADSWTEFVSLERPVLGSNEELVSVVAQIHSQSLQYLDKKASAPLDAIAPDAEFHVLLDRLRQFDASIDEYNTAIAGVNESIATFKSSLESGNVASLEKQIKELKAAQARGKADVRASCTKLTEALAAKNQIETDKAEAKASLDSYIETVLQRYRNRLNALLDNFSAGFRIGPISRTYQGGETSVSYQIEINGTNVEIGNKPRGTPSFRTTLSAGDRSTLALAFFLVQLEESPALADTVIVFDDPFTSLDRFRRTCTQQEICRKVDQAKQVIVLSHDPHFLKLVWDSFPHTRIKTLQLARAGDSTTINEWDIETEVQEGYMRDFLDLQAFVHRGTGEPRDVARKIRPLLEGHLRFRFPNQFPGNEWLGDFINRIATADQTSPLHPLQSHDLPEIRAVNDYSKKYHHQQNPAADSEPIDSSELEAYSRRALKLVNGF